MAKTMFSRDVAFKPEDERNAFVVCIGLSQRARDINYHRKQVELEGLEPEEGESSSSVRAMLDFAEGRIVLDQDEGYVEDPAEPSPEEPAAPSHPPLT